MGKENMNIMSNILLCTYVFLPSVLENSFELFNPIDFFFFSEIAF